MEKIYKVIDETPYISEVRKRFYKKILRMRYDMILKECYEELIEKRIEGEDYEGF